MTDPAARFRYASAAQWARCLAAPLGQDAEVRLTPALQTHSLAGGWRRAEVIATLPEGATLSLRWAVTADEGLRASLDAIAADPAHSDAEKIDGIGTLLGDVWSPSVTYAGEAGGGAAERFTFPAPASDPPVAWIEVRLLRNSAAEPPRLERLDVLHEGAGLIDHLPAVYRGAGDVDGTLRRLVDVLEATTEDVDAAIARLAERLDPARTAAAWLPGLAAMLGLPFDAALSEAMQRRLVGAARAILAGRGTRAGLIALAEALFPRRGARIVDLTERLSPIMLGGAGRGGGRLPALLAGPSTRMPRLSARLVLGRTVLRPWSPCDEGLHNPGPEVLVRLPATPAERRRYGAGVRHMLEAMVPANVRLRLRWAAWHGEAAAGRDEALAVVADPGPLTIGDGPPLGAARLAGSLAPHIDRNGAIPAGHRLA